MDVSIENINGNFQTKVYKKPTDPGIYLNNKSECPEKYKDGTIKNLIHRTYSISSNPTIFQNSIKSLKQAFVNNGYSNNKFDKVLNQYLDAKFKNSPHDTPETSPDNDVISQ